MSRNFFNLETYNYKMVTVRVSFSSQ